MWIAIVALGLLCVVLAWLWLEARRRSAQTKGTPPQLEEALRNLQGLASELRGRYEALESQSQGQILDREQERKAYKDLATRWSDRIDSINTSLSKISDDATRKVDDMASTLKPIVSIFRSPQAAGIEFGEAELEVLLKAHLGESLYLRKPQLLALGQDVVDFAIKLPDCLVPIDSKFPSQQYRAWVDAANEMDARAAWRGFRDQLIRQMQATAKYIKPDAGTTDYALLFVPSDVIFQQAFLMHRVYDQENPIPQKSQELQVFPCSPLTLMPIFSLIRLGLRNLKIAEDVKGVRSQIDELNLVFRGFIDSDWQLLRKHLQTLVSHVERISGERGSVTRLRDTIRRLSDFSQEHPSGGSVSPEELLSAPLEVQQ